MSLLDTRMDGTSTEMITQCIYLKLSANTNHKRLLRNHWDLSNSSVSVEEENTFGGIFFLRLKVSQQ
jgi:hypothetical protein